MLLIFEQALVANGGLVLGRLLPCDSLASFVVLSLPSSIVRPCLLLPITIQLRQLTTREDGYAGRK